MSLAEVSEVLLIRMTSACTLFYIRDVLHAGRSGVWICLGTRHFSFFHYVHYSSGAQISVKWVLGFLLGVKWPGCQVSHSSPSSAKVKSDWSYSSTPSICLHGVDRTTLLASYWTCDCNCHHLTDTITSETAQTWKLVKQVEYLNLYWTGWVHFSSLLNYKKLQMKQTVLGADSGHSISSKFCQSELTDGIPKLRFFLYNVIHSIYTQLYISIVMFIFIYTQITLWQYVSTIRWSLSGQ